AFAGHHAFRSHANLDQRRAGELNNNPAARACRRLPVRVDKRAVIGDAVVFDAEAADGPYENAADRLDEACAVRLNPVVAEGKLLSGDQRHTAKANSGTLPERLVAEVEL